ncbi:MAG TPA: hypothetical protein VM284_03440 [Candidatus Limnocylindria bacterium]|nr:hypothetical protein [Candidatus Limnocylindria bacterium]
MQTLIVDTLKVWREAERVLQDLPPVHSDHETVRVLVIQLRSLYARLSETRDVSGDVIDRSKAQIEAAKTLLRKVRPDGL